jgi:hypothetical protein
VGTVWVATAIYPFYRADSAIRPEPLVRSFSRHFPGYRDDVRFGAALSSLGAVEVALDAAQQRE